MKTLILDGYNIIYKIPELSAALKDNLEKARDGLAAFVTAWKRANVFGGRVYIVFDGKSGISSPPRAIQDSMKFVFTPTGQTADDKIISMVQGERNRNSLIVVSDDNYIINEARHYGALVKSVKEFSEMSGGRKRGDEKNIPKGSEEEINDFLKGQWGI